MLNTGDKLLIHVYELPFELFHLTAPLFEQAWFDEMYMKAVLKGRAPGRIFVDDPNAPTAALMCRTYEYYVAGDASNAALRQFIKDAPAEPGVFQALYGYAPVGKAWEEAILADYDGQLISIPRHNFRWAGAAVMNWREALPDGARVVAVTRELAERIDREWHETLGLLWEGYDNYMRYAYGFVLMIGGELASMASSDSIGDRAVNIGVRTAPQFRRQGLARLVCSAFIEHTLERGLEPTWDTDGMNHPSRALAESLGFVEGQMFSQLSTPDYKPLVVNGGLWHEVAGEGGVRVWERE
jgi:RimJ/RimL family protein N-acetyltransferase